MATNPFSNQATVSFLGTRWRMFWILVLGYILSLFTLGIYRFWLVTKKRRFYWSNTLIDGEALEYTGTAVQLLVGFLIAIGVFLPLYGFFFFLSTQNPQAAMYGYTGAAIFLFFLSGYAAYRGRRFLLSRTIWRGIRFSQSGNAWSYAFRRFFWSVLTLATLGLAYPFMAASLWRYRYNNTWFGDRKCTFNGSWKHIAGPYYFSYFVFVGLLVSGLYLLDEATQGRPFDSQTINEAPLVFGLLSGSILFLVFSYFFLRSRITSRMLSTLSIGKAEFRVRVKARSLIGQQIAYFVFLILTAFLFLLLVGYVMGDVLEPLLNSQQAELSDVLQLGWYNFIIFGLIYLAFMANLALLSELIFGLGFWRLVARGTVISNEQDLRTIRANGEESPLAGEGLADALHVGAY
ncbi:MAG: DUF898 domain-containing protein [Devosiaceae bacterium]|nr:DUF898 domain-containing protein [Devosiaceae bacterium]